MGSRDCGRWEKVQRKSWAPWPRVGGNKAESGAHNGWSPSKPASWCWPDKARTPRGWSSGAELRSSHLRVSSPPPRSLPGRSSAARGRRPAAGPQESEEEAGLGFLPPSPQQVSLPPTTPHVPVPAVPTTTLSFQLTTDVPNPCPALKIWKVWESTFRVSSSGGHKTGRGVEARLSTSPLTPPFPSLPDTHQIRRTGGNTGRPRASRGM